MSHRILVTGSEEAGRPGPAHGARSAQVGYRRIGSAGGREAKVGASGVRVGFARRSLGVLHDWDDALALRRQRQARCGLPSGRRLFVIEIVLPEDGVAGGLCNLHLLVVTDGKERTASEYAAFLGPAGFDHGAVRGLPGMPSIVVGMAK